jgi:toxin ParE1/3/4
VTGSRPARVALRPLARTDLLDAWHYIAADSSLERADAYLRRVAHTLDRLAEQPYMGRARPELAPGLRSFPALSHVAFYYPAEDGIIVARVLHGRRDVEQVSF